MRQLSSNQVHAVSGGAPSIWDAIKTPEFNALVTSNFLKNPIGTIGGLLGMGLLYLLLGSDL